MMQTDEKHRTAYSGRQSVSTRNPHGASSQAKLSESELAKLSQEERVLAQWRSACGEPISDEAKALFEVVVGDKHHRLGDVRLWAGQHGNKSKSVEETGCLYLEFFFDGSPSEYNREEDVFIKAFEDMVHKQLQERRIVEFRQKMAMRRRHSSDSEGARSRGRAAARSNEDGDADPEGSSRGRAGDDDKEWRDFLQKPVPETNLQVRSLREAGCMLTFLVVQTSLSVSAAEVLGQISFQEHFPIDGKPQEPSKSTKPMPRWVYGMIALTVLFLTITIFAWWMVLREAISSPVAPEVAAPRLEGGLLDEPSLGA